jgi:hypothetical protein
MNEVNITPLIVLICTSRYPADDRRFASDSLTEYLLLFFLLTGVI